MMFYLSEGQLLKECDKLLSHKFKTKHIFIVTLYNTDLPNSLLSDK